MGRDEMWLRAAAQVLEATEPAEARAGLVAALQRHTDAGLVTRVHVTGSDAVDLYVTGELPQPADIRSPSAAAVRGHPLNRYHEQTGDYGPTVLTEAIGRGFPLDPVSRDTMADLGITEHQLSIPVAARGANYDGWVLVSDRPFDEAVVTDLARVHALIRGLDRHVRLLARARRPGDPESPRLTEREHVILGHMTRGGTAAGIAARLAISPRTVHKHQENLYRKLGAVDRLSAVLAAQRAGLVGQHEEASGIPLP